MEKIKRIYAFDIVRGFAILFMIIMHTGLHVWTGANDLESGSSSADFGMTILLFFLTIAGVYSAILGAVNSFMFEKRVSSGKNSPKQIILFSLLIGIIMIGLHFVFRLLFSGDSGILYFVIQSGEIHPITPFWLISSSALTILGLNTIFVPIVLSIIIKRSKNWQKSSSIYLVLFYLGMGILLLTIPLRLYLAPIVDQLINTQHYGIAWFLGIFVYDNFPIFPITAYSCFGAILGIALARQEKPSYILNYVWFNGIFWFGAGMIGLILGGGMHPGAIYASTREGILEDFYRHITQLGMVFIFFGLALSILDFAPSEKKSKRVKLFTAISRYGMISLTAYMFEGIISILFAQLLNFFNIFDGWNDNLLYVILFGCFLAVLWGIMAYFWEKIAYKYSVEWFLIQIAGKFSGKKSQKYDLERIKVEDKGE